MSDPLFVYGTLLPGHAPAAMAEICRGLKPLGHARVAGQLFDLGPYPAVTIGGDSRIDGELVEVDCDATWKALDEYEGCPRPGEGDGLFRRVRTVATLDSGDTVDCWIYVYNRDLCNARMIACGCWRTHCGLV